MHPDVLAQLRRSGFEQLDERRWELRTSSRPGGYTGRGAYLTVGGEGPEVVYSIDVEEFRGGEGYEDEVARTTSPDEAVAEIARWTAWANEPFEPPTSWWRRLRAYFGG